VYPPHAVPAPPESAASRTCCCGAGEGVPRSFHDLAIRHGLHLPAASDDGPRRSTALVILSSPARPADAGPNLWWRPPDGAFGRAIVTAKVFVGLVLVVNILGVRHRREMARSGHAAPFVYPPPGSIRAAPPAPCAYPTESRRRCCAVTQRERRCRSSCGGSHRSNHPATCPAHHGADPMVERELLAQLE
jgi:hypothetical protein